MTKQHMASLVAMLESYESLIGGKIGNPMLIKEDYDQIDAEELELMDVKWCLASAFRRAEKFQQITGRDEFRGMATSPLGFDKSKINEVLDIEERFRPEVLITVGYAAEKVEPSYRLPVDEIIDKR